MAVARRLAIAMRGEPAFGDLAKGRDACMGYILSKEHPLPTTSFFLPFVFACRSFGKGDR